MKKVVRFQTYLVLGLVCLLLLTLLYKNSIKWGFSLITLSPKPHDLAHVLSDFNYKLFGLDGVKNCQEEFLETCLNTIIVTHFLKKGEAIDITKVCSDPICYHKLGRGALVFFDYELPRAVSFCKKLPKQQYFECTGGILKELTEWEGIPDYKTWETKRQKYLRADDPLYPCSSELIPLDVKPQCYFYISLRLLDPSGVNLNSLDSKTIEQAFSSCFKLSEEKFRSSCIGGLGNEFIFFAKGSLNHSQKKDNLSPLDLLQIYNWCKLAKQDSASCISFAAGSLFGSKNKDEAALQFCQKLPSNQNDCQVSILTQIKNSWGKLIDDIGANKAYSEFKNKYQNLSGDRQHETRHLLAHVFGELLYQKLALDGIGVCDDSFDFGCFHSFFALALDQKGTPAVKELDLACINKLGSKAVGCQHGIGHGLLSYLGEDKLEEALNFCHSLTWKKPFGGCSSGVFMEYFFPTFSSHSGISPLKPRQLENDHYKPCNFLSKKFKPTCFFELPSWWEALYQRDYPKMGKICADIKESAYEEYCFLGLGHIVGPSLEYNPKKVIEICQTMPQPENNIFCRAGAYGTFIGESSQRSLAPELCEGLSAEDKNICLTRGDPNFYPDF